MSFLWTAAAQATVYEYNADGTVLKHEAFDYRSANGEGQVETLLLAIMQTYPFFPATNGYEVSIQKAAARYGLNADLIRAVIRAESAGKQDAVSSKGAQGLMQLMPATARQYGVVDPFDPEQNIDGGSKYLSYLFTRYGGNTKLALAAYNAGEGTVDKYGGIPPYTETRNYIRKIENDLKDNMRNQSAENHPQ